MDLRTTKSFSVTDGGAAEKSEFKANLVFRCKSALLFFAALLLTGCTSTTASGGTNRWNATTVLVAATVLVLSKIFGSRRKDGEDSG